MAAGTATMITACSGSCSGFMPVAANGTSSAALQVDRQWHDAWQQSPCPLGTPGECAPCEPADIIIAASPQCGAAFADRDCAACMTFAANTGGAPNASAVHASSASASVARKMPEFGRGRRRMHGA